MAKFSCRFMIHTSVPCLVLSNICKADTMRLGKEISPNMRGPPFQHHYCFCTNQLTRPKRSQNKRVKIADWGKGGFGRVGYIPIISYLAGY